MSSIFGLCNSMGNSYFNMGSVNDGHLLIIEIHKKNGFMFEIL